MPKEVVITRKQVIVVDTVDSNEYGDMLFTDKEGTNYKVGNKRVQFFEGVIVSGAAVQLNYAEAYNKEYIYNAVQVKGELPEAKDPIKPELQEDEPTDEALRKMISKGEPSPAQLKKPTEKPPAPQEVGMWWKEIGLWLREGKVKEDTPWGKSLKLSYFNEMKRVLPLVVVPDEEIDIF